MNYHAHVYFDEQTLNTAEELIAMADQTGWFIIGRVHKKLVGPHNRWSCNLVFQNENYNEVYQWLERNRQELTIFIHPVTTDHIKDHTTNAIWLGEKTELNIEVLSR